MPARLMAPGLGAQQACCIGTEGSPYLEANQLASSLSYKFQNSFRDFHGHEEIPFPSPPILYADTYVNIFDVDLTYAATKRLNFSLGIPIKFGSRTTYYEHDLVHLHTMRASGVGDLRLVGIFWLLDPDTNRDHNIALGLGVKIPTGNDRAMDTSFRPTGPIQRPVDPAIQPGDGGWGVLFELQAFSQIFKNTYAYLEGVYLASPREMNGTQTPFGDDPAATGGDIGYIIDSVPDQYLGRVGLVYAIWPKAGLSITLGGRIEGVPVEDLIGGSQGYRIPGHAISIEPGIALTRGRFSASITAPVALERYANKSLADVRTHSPIGGFAAFADYLVTASVSIRF